MMWLVPYKFKCYPLLIAAGCTFTFEKFLSTDPR